MIVDPALAINRNWKLGQTEIRQFKRRYPKTTSLPRLKDPVSIRKLLAFAIVAGVILSQCAVVILPVHAPSLSINIQSFAFNPQNATIEAGDSVTWTNNDPVIYTLWFTNSSDASTYLLSPPINPGTTWSHTFPDKIGLTYYDSDRLYITGHFIVVSVLRADFFPTFSSSLTVTFLTTLSGGTTPYKVLWVLGDGTNSTASTPSHTYASFRSYNVTLTVTDSSSPNPFSVSVLHLVTISRTSGGGRHPLEM